MCSKAYFTEQPVDCIDSSCKNKESEQYSAYMMQNWDTCKLVLSYEITHLFIEVDCGVESVVFQGCCVSLVLSVQQHKADVLYAGLLIQGKQDSRC